MKHQVGSFWLHVQQFPESTILWNGPPVPVSLCTRFLSTDTSSKDRQSERSRSQSYSLDPALHLCEDPLNNSQFFSHHSRLHTLRVTGRQSVKELHGCAFLLFTSEILEVPSNPTFNGLPSRYSANSNPSYVFSPLAVARIPCSPFKGAKRYSQWRPLRQYQAVMSCLQILPSGRFQSHRPLPWCSPDAQTAFRTKQMAPTTAWHQHGPVSFTAQWMQLWSWKRVCRESSHTYLDDRTIEKGRASSPVAMSSFTKRTLPESRGGQMALLGAHRG